MKAASTKFKTVDEYISAFPPSTQKILKDVRKIIHEAAPQAEDVISYNMPATKLKSILVYYAAYEKHIGFYPTASPIDVFKDQLSDPKEPSTPLEEKLGQRNLCHSLFDSPP